MADQELDNESPGFRRIEASDSLNIRLEETASIQPFWEWVEKRWDVILWSFTATMLAYGAGLFLPWYLGLTLTVTVWSLFTFKWQATERRIEKV